MHPPPPFCEMSHAGRASVFSSVELPPTFDIIKLDFMAVGAFNLNFNFRK